MDHLYRYQIEINEWNVTPLPVSEAPRPKLKEKTKDDNFQRTISEIRVAANRRYLLWFTDFWAAIIITV